MSGEELRVVGSRVRKVDGVELVTGRAKFVRSEFVEKIKQSTHWQHQAMVPNQLASGVDIWS